MSGRRPIVLINLAGTSLIVMTAVAGFGGLRFNLTPSEPLGLCRITAPQFPITVGDLVFVCTPRIALLKEAFARGYLRRGLCRGGVAPPIKALVAGAGQHIAVGTELRIDGVPLPHSVPRTRDAAGRPLTPFAGGIVPARHVFLHSPFARSYDSRYFGPVLIDGVLGLARPLLTIAP